MAGTPVSARNTCTTGKGAQPLGPVQVLECTARLRFVGSLHTHCSQQTAFRLATGLYDFALSIPELRLNPHAFR